ncbi:MAG: DUF1549 domain-containing protein [Planctomycetaceae bacterium]
MLLRLVGLIFVSIVLLLPLGRYRSAWTEDVPATKSANQFREHVAPLLTRKCVGCHNPSDKKGGLDLTHFEGAIAGGDSGTALVPKNTTESLMWKRIAADEMPPKHPLSEQEKQTLRAWIDRGADWGTETLDPFQYTTETRGGYDWWSLQPLSHPVIPETTDRGWSRQPLDAFILAKLESHDLSPAPEADRRTLIRRAYFDLVGLPPTPNEVADFIADPDPEAYEALIERLLASPQYGERWARHWLDVIRFGESQGFERDKIRTNSWRYRDWVMQSLNENLPYDEFVKRQLAGDSLFPDDPQSLIATGFLVAGAYDEVGQTQQSAPMKAVVRQDELEDLVATVGQTFLGLTVNCSRCHNHKFDPISQQEYYQLTAVLAGVRHGDRDIDLARLPTSATQTGTWDSRIATLRHTLARFEQPHRAAILAERKAKYPQGLPKPKPIASWNFDNELQDSIGTLHGMTKGGAQVHQGHLELDGRGSYMFSPPIERDITEKTLEAWVRLRDLDQRGAGIVSLQSLNGNVFDAIVFGEQDAKHWMAGSNSFERTQSFGGPEETHAHEEFVHFAITYQADGTITGYRNGRIYGNPYMSKPPVTFLKGEAQIVIGLRHAPPGGNKMLAGTVDKVQLYDRALQPAEIAASSGTLADMVDDAEITARLTPEQNELRNRWLFEIGHLETQRTRQLETKIYAVTPSAPEPAYVLTRGNPTQREAEVTPGGMRAISALDADFHLTKDASDSERRKKIADWIANNKNPLFARVIVNRLWHYHFGKGIVDTPSDLGFNGGRPTHPELLDFLAQELLRHDFDLKALHRQIMTSATYRQGFVDSEAATRVDAENRLLWRRNPTRMDAEVLRDAILMTAGEMNTVLGGPGYQDFVTYVRNAQFYQMLDPEGESFHRRSLYRTWLRSGRNPFLDVWDCPDPSTRTPERAVTTTPLQALSQLNNSMILRMADRWGERIVRKAGKDPVSQIRKAYQLAYQREPTAEELPLLEAFLTEQGLSPLCRVLLNSNEFLYVD